MHVRDLHFFSWTWTLQQACCLGPQKVKIIRVNEVIRGLTQYTLQIWRANVPMLWTVDTHLAQYFYDCPVTGRGGCDLRAKVIMQLPTSRNTKHSEPGCTSWYTVDLYIHIRHLRHMPQGSSSHTSPYTPRSPSHLNITAADCCCEACPDQSREPPDIHSCNTS